MTLNKHVLLVFFISSLLSACQSPVVASNNQPSKPPPSRDWQPLKLDQPFTAKIYSLGCGIGCPIYTLAIQPDFSATYKGLAFVKNTSEHQFLMTQASRSQWQKLMQQMKQQTKTKSNVAGCNNYRTDALRYRISVKQQDQSYEKILDKGCNSALAARLESFSNGLVSRWISRRSQSKIK